MGDRPYVSFVVVARNDNYGGDFLSRINVFIGSLITLCEKYSLSSELVIVEWNPPDDRPRLKDAISWPDIRMNSVRIRIIEVPNEAHERLPNPERMRLFEYIGKNVGVRCARGEYIVTTNPDTIFNDDLIKFLALRKLSRKRFYRIDRHDVATPIPVDVPVEVQLQYCKENVIRIFGYFWSCYDRKISGRFWLYRKARSLATYAKARVLHFTLPPAHMGAPGDFLLMHRDQWNIIKGFPELETKGKSHCIDGLGVLMAQFSGLKQVILKRPLRLYHQDHGRADHGWPRSQAVKAAYEKLSKAHKLITFNIKWGLEGENLAELDLQRLQSIRRNTS